MTKNTITKAHKCVIEAEGYLALARNALHRALEKELSSHHEDVPGITASEIITISHRRPVVRAILHAMIKLDDGPMHEIERLLDKNRSQ